MPIVALGRTKNTNLNIAYLIRIYHRDKHVNYNKYFASEMKWDERNIIFKISLRLSKKLYTAYINIYIEENNYQTKKAKAKKTKYNKKSKSLNSLSISLL